VLPVVVDDIVPRKTGSGQNFVGSTECNWWAHIFQGLGEPFFKGWATKKRSHDAGLF